MKVFCAGLATETNCFSPLPTADADFSTGRNGGLGFMYFVQLDRARHLANQRGWEFTESVVAHAQPAGPTVKSVYEGYRSRILLDLRQSLPVDIVFLSLHGAMVADGYDDCEGDLLHAVRMAAGPDATIGAELDPHCVLTRRMITNATAIVCYKEYPHTDFAARADDLFRILADAAEGHVSPVMSVFDCQMIGTYHTRTEPMRSFVDDLSAREGTHGVLSISIAHGFPWSDVPESGTKVLAITDGRPDQGAALAAEVGHKLIALRGTTAAPYLTINEGLRRVQASQTHPVVIADISDNPGGGAPADATMLLAGILERGVENVAFGMVWDPIVVGIARGVGPGARIQVRLGGKMGPTSGTPLDLPVEVLQIVDELEFDFAGHKVQIGPAVALRHGTVDVVVIAQRVQTVSPASFTNLGIDVRRKDIIVVKSSEHFRAEFAPIAAEILYVNSGGALNMDFSSIPYEHIDRPMWPLDKT